MKQLLLSIIITLSIPLPMNTLAQHIDQQKMEQVHMKEDSTSGKCAVIDKISIPANAIVAYAEKAEYIRDLVRQQPGFIKYEIFQLKGDSGDIKVITIATWADRKHLDSARLVIRESMNKAGLHMPRFLEKNGITMERGVYILVEE